jgi:hypothetical protein
MAKDLHKCLPMLMLLVMSLSSVIKAQVLAGVDTVDGLLYANPGSRRPILFQGAPYSADQTYETTLAYPDGSRVVIERFRRLYRDSRGRTRIEIFSKDMLPATPKAAVQAGAVEISDPTASFLCVLDSRLRVVHRIKTAEPITPSRAPRSSNTGSRGPLPAGMSFEELGKRDFFGQQAIGQRLVNGSVPEMGGTSGKLTTETWVVPELNLTMLLDISGGGYRTLAKIVALDKGEPDTSLFELPLGYSIVDQSESFSVSLLVH